MAESKHEEAVGQLRQLDDLLQHRTRLGTCVLLSDADALSFKRLRELLGETDGNMGAHLRKLSDAGYVTVRKEFVDLKGNVLKKTAVGVFKPVTWYSLSTAGRKALKAHLGALEALIRQANGDDK